jgi:hypothetical protein
MKKEEQRSEIIDLGVATIETRGNLIGELDSDGVSQRAPFGGIADE